MINQFLSRQNGELQMQMLQLPTNDNIRQEKLDKYLGIAHGFTDPFNLFINMTDIEENKDLILQQLNLFYQGLSVKSIKK